MRVARFLPLLLLPLLAVAAPADDYDAAQDGPVRRLPLLNVELEDARGVTTRLAGWHRLSGEDHFEGYLGAAEIEVPYARIRELRVRAPAQPGGRARADLSLATGREVQATFDQREGEMLFRGFASFGRVTVYFRDIRRLRVLGKTKRADLPKYGKPARGVDALLEDRFGVKTELVEFRRLAHENVVPGLRGATSIEIPLRIVGELALTRVERDPLLGARVVLRDGETVDFRIPSTNDETAFGGAAPFGALRIRLEAIRRLTVHRVTPRVRALDPVEAAEGRATEDPPAR